MNLNKIFFNRTTIVKNINIKRYNTLIPWAIQNEFKSHEIISADKCYLYTKDNNTNKTNKIMDFTSGLMVVNLGYNNKYITKGFKEHLKTGISFINSQFMTDQREYLSNRLINITDNYGGKVFYIKTMFLYKNF